MVDHTLSKDYKAKETSYQGLFVPASRKPMSEEKRQISVL